MNSPSIRLALTVLKSILSEEYASVLAVPAHNGAHTLISLKISHSEIIVLQKQDKVLDPLYSVT